MYWYYGHMAHIPEIKLSYLILYLCTLYRYRHVSVILFPRYRKLQNHVSMQTLYISSLENSLLSISFNKGSYIGS